MAADKFDVKIGIGLDERGMAQVSKGWESLAKEATIFNKHLRKIAVEEKKSGLDRKQQNAELLDQLGKVAAARKAAAKAQKDAAEDIKSLGKEQSNWNAKLEEFVVGLKDYAVIAQKIAGIAWEQYNAGLREMLKTNKHLVATQEKLTEETKKAQMHFAEMFTSVTEVNTAMKAEIELLKILQMALDDLSGSTDTSSDSFLGFSLSLIPGVGQMLAAANATEDLINYFGNLQGGVAETRVEFNQMTQAFRIFVTEHDNFMATAPGRGVTDRGGPNTGNMYGGKGFGAGASAKDLEKLRLSGRPRGGGGRAKPDWVALQAAEYAEIRRQEDLAILRQKKRGELEAKFTRELEAQKRLLPSIVALSGGIAGAGGIAWAATQAPQERIKGMDLRRYPPETRKSVAAALSLGGGIAGQADVLEGSAAAADPSWAGYGVPEGEFLKPITEDVTDAAKELEKANVDAFLMSLGSAAKDAAMSFAMMVAEMSLAGDSAAVNGQKIAASLLMTFGQFAIMYGSAAMVIPALGGPVAGGLAIAAGIAMQAVGGHMAGGVTAGGGYGSGGGYSSANVRRSDQRTGFIEDKDSESRQITWVLNENEFRSFQSRSSKDDARRRRV